MIPLRNIGPLQYRVTNSKSETIKGKIVADGKRKKTPVFQHTFSFIAENRATVMINLALKTKLFVKNHWSRFYFLSE